MVAVAINKRRCRQWSEIIFKTSEDLNWGKEWSFVSPENVSRSRKLCPWCQAAHCRVNQARSFILR